VGFVCRDAPRMYRRGCNGFNKRAVLRDALTFSTDHGRHLGSAWVGRVNIVTVRDCWVLREMEEEGEKVNGKLRDKLLVIAARHEDLAEAYGELSDLVGVDAMENAIGEMNERGDVLVLSDQRLASWVLKAIEQQASHVPFEGPDALSMKTLTEIVKDRHEVDLLKPRRVGYVVREIIGLETRRTGEFRRYCVLYDEGVIEAWKERYGD